MKYYDRVTPASTRDMLFEECEALRDVQNSLYGLFVKSGCKEVKTPALEYYDVFGRFYAQVPPVGMLKLTDSNNRLICMRPDCTVPIARLVSSKLSGEQPPFRLFYEQQIFSSYREHTGKSAECWQVGVELIGEGGEESDIGVLSLATQSLLTFGDFSLDVCHVGYFEALLSELLASEDVKLNIRTALAGKNEPQLKSLLLPFKGQQAAAALSEILFLSGGGETIEKARALTENPAALKALDELSGVVAGVHRLSGEARVDIDLGAVAVGGYYTGICFRGYINGVGQPVLSGGRYDNLLGQFGRELPATGFSVNASLLAKNILKSNDKRVIIERKGSLTIALTKGRLEKMSVKLFEKLGFDCSPLHDKGRRLVFSLPGSGISVILAKASDVITYVENGAADIGIVGKDTIAEMGGDYYEMLDLGFGCCRFALAAKSREAVFGGHNTKMIATKYPRVALGYFNRLGMDVEIIKIEGSVELAPIIGLSDAIVDIVETGDTLRENGLSVVEDIMDVSARLIVNKAALKLKNEAVCGLLASIRKHDNEEDI